MKLQLDTTTKTIKIEADVVLSELMELLDKILPGEWKKYTLQTNTTITNWSYPLIIKEYIKEQKTYPWYGDNNRFYCSTSNTQLKTGTYNIEA